MVGKSLGHYEILGSLGSGGMGDVYLAEDAHLGRKVALKVLPDEFAADPQRRARFEREAKLLAALNHANIATIYGLEQADGVSFIAMELVEGETLSQRLASGVPLAVDEALRIARQIADGLEAAHVKGIIHRDLKPANVMITQTGTAKVLDFGIATSLSDSMVGATSATALTTAGTVLGTPHYMSPEQIRGEAIDKRADIWAFGGILFEALTGKAAFGRETVADTMAAIIDQEPDWSLIPPSTPELARGVVQRCLTKDLDHRIHDIADARIELEEAISPRKRRRRSSYPWRGYSWTPFLLRGAITGVLLAAVGWVIWSVSPQFLGARPLPVGQPYPVTTSDAWESQPAISPDGSRIAFSANHEGNSDIYVVDAQGGEPVVLVDHPSADTDPAWFPDGSVAFASDRNGGLGIWRVPQFGGGATLLVPGAGEPAISPDGSTVAFSRAVPSGHLRIGVAPVGDPAGGNMLTGNDGGLWDHTGPAWSPDGTTICYASRDGLWLVEVAGGRPRPLTTGGHYDVEPVWSFDGRYVYYSSALGGRQALWRVRTTGDTPPEQVTMGMGPESHPSLSRSGNTLAYATGTTQRELVLLDRESGGEALLSNLPEDLMPAVAPDNSKVVYVSRRWGLDEDLWVQPIVGGAPSSPPFRLVEGPNIPSHPSFSPDGRWIAYYRIRDEHRDVFVVPAVGGAPIAFTEGAGQNYHPAWSGDGSQLAFVSERTGSTQLWIAPFKDGRRDGASWQLTHENALVWAPDWSPDGSLIAYIRVEGDRSDVWVVPASGAGSPTQVTVGADASRVRWDATPDFLLVSARWGDPQRLTLRRVPARGGEAQPLIPSVSFGSGFGVFDVSLDGRFLAFSRGALEGDIWVFRVENGVY